MRSRRETAGELAEMLRHVEEQQQRILAELPIVIWSVDRDRRFVMLAGRTEVFGLDAAHWLGRPFDDVSLAPGASERLDRALAGESFTERVDAAGRCLRAHWFPRVDASGAIEGAGGFALDLTEYEHAEQERREADAHFRAIAENVDAVVWISSANLDRLIYVSPSFERVFGLPAAGVIAEPGQWVATVHPDDRERVLAAAQACPWHQDQTHRVLWPDGTVRWVDVRVRPVRDALGRAVSSVGVAADVTEMRNALDELRRTEVQLRRSLAEKDALLREVHHRVRNNLQVVQSLLSLQDRGVTDPAARRVLRDSQRRVHALALVHESLYQADLSAVELGAYLRRLLDALGAAYSDGTGRVSIVIDVGLEGTAPVQTAIHTGIAVAELVANAFEHAFPDHRRGRVAIEATRTEGGLHVDVADDGVGLPDRFSVDGCRTLGLTLVTTLLAADGGTLSIVPSASGTCFRVALPLRSD